MTAQNTTQIPVGATWQSIVAGPVAGILIFESTATDCYFAVANEPPGASVVGHAIFPGKQYTLPLEAGNTLYVRSRSGGASLTYTYTDGSLLPALDQRVYDGRFRAITTQPFSEANVKNGTQFYAGIEFLTIAQGASVDVLFVPDMTPVLVKGREIRTNGDNVLYQVYRGTSFSGGTAVPIHNYNEVTPAATTVSMLSGPTVTNPGLLIDSQPIYGSVSAGNRVSGFTQTSGIERRLAFATPYLARITNRSTTAAASVWYGLTWYEGPLSTEV
jgi:hypothetical protein